MLSFIFSLKHRFNVISLILLGAFLGFSAAHAHTIETALYDQYLCKKPPFSENHLLFLVIQQLNDQSYVLSLRKVTHESDSKDEKTKPYLKASRKAVKEELIKEMRKTSAGPKEKNPE